MDPSNRTQLANDISQLLRNESGKHNPNRISDLELCELIDGTFVPRMSRGEKDASIYQIAYSRRVALFDYIKKNLWKFHRFFLLEI